MAAKSPAVAGKQKAFASFLSMNKDWRAAAREAAEQTKQILAGRPCDCAVFFVSEAYPGLDPEELSATLSSLLGGPALLGCNASGVAGAESEIEMQPGLSLLAMRLPGARISSFAFSAQDLAAFSSGADLVKSLDLYPTDKPNFLCLADPMSCDVDKLLGLFNAGYPERPVIGGLASGAAVGRESWLSLDGKIEPAAACGLAFSGDVQFEVIVSQGCRPIGEPLIITKAEGNVLRALAGRPPLEILRETLERLPPRDQALARHSLFVGLAMNERRQEFKRGDFLVRNLIGSDPETGALVIGAALRPGQTLQFQLRDARTSAEDLAALLKRLPESGEPQAQGAVLTECCGRGRGLYGESHHDVRAIQSLRGNLPLAGFFANGEFGPVDGVNYVHGYTASLAVIK